MIKYKYIAFITLTFAILGGALSADEPVVKDREARFRKLFETPINFWGKVVDHENNPVANIEVSCLVLDNPVWSNGGDNASKYIAVTDKDGNFEILNKKGASLSVIARAKGYAPAYDETGLNISRAGLDYSNPAGINYSRIPTKDKPYVLILRKKGEFANLKEIKPHRVDIPKDGRMKEVLLSGTPITLNVKCWSSAPEPFTYDFYDWRAEVSVVGGKLRPIVDEHSVMAPKDGYLDMIKIDMPANIEEHWRRASSPRQTNVWVRMDNGIYAKLDMDVITGRQHLVRAEGLLNLDGDNSFEEKSNK